MDKPDSGVEIEWFEVRIRGGRPLDPRVWVDARLGEAELVEQSGFGWVATTPGASGIIAWGSSSDGALRGLEGALCGKVGLSV